MRYSKWFLVFFLGLLLITMLGIFANQHVSTVIEQILNGFKCIGGLCMAWILWLNRKKFIPIVASGFLFFCSIVPVYAIFHAINVIKYHNGGGFIVNAGFHYLVLICYLSLYCLIKDRNARIR